MSASCKQCADKLGARVAADMIITVHMGNCSICGEWRELTPFSDFGRSRSVLDVAERDAKLDVYK